MIHVPTIARTQEITTAINWFNTCPGLPSTQPSGRAFPAESLSASLIAFVAKTPVSSAPNVPPAPWTPNASSVSSYPNLPFTVETIQKQTMPASKPISRAGKGFTKPDAGVIATSPATHPEIPPSMLGLPCFTHSANIQPSAAAAAPKCVATKALVASPLALTALPALKPNQPTQSKQAPITLSVRLCGFIGSFGKPTRLPRYKAHTKALTPEVMCTTVPPAKSNVGTLPPRNAFNNPPLPHTICAIGK